MEEKRQKLVTFAPSMFCVCVFYLSSRGGGLYCGVNRGAGGSYKSARGLITESELQMGNEIYLI
jgi:hypothetical protein